MSGTIVFFDGVCNLCNGAVDFLIRRDRRGELKFASLQGETARRMLPQKEIEQLSSIVVWNNGALLKESDAILFLGEALGGLWKILARGARLVPRPLRDGIYRLVARHRYSWFGQRSSCRIPSSEEKSRFLV